MSIEKLPNLPVRMPQDLLDAIHAWDKTKLANALSLEIIHLPVYVPDDWTYPHPLFYALESTRGLAERYWQSGGQEGDPRPFLDVFLDKGALLDWDEQRLPEDVEKFRMSFGFRKDTEYFDRLFSTMCEVLNNHLAEILVPYFAKAGAHFHLPSEPYPHLMLEQFMDGMFFNENVLRFKQLVTPASLHILTLLDEAGCLDTTYMQHEVEGYPGKVVGHYWQAWQDLQLQKQLQETLPTSLMSPKKGFI